MNDLPGLDLERLRTHLGTGSLRGELIAGGRSNLTYRVTDGAATWVLRRPPLGHVLATAHDMSREYRVITALAPTRVPVPATHSLCTDESVIGAPFYLMEHVEGTVYREASQTEHLGEKRAHRLAENLVDVLVDLHAVNPAEVGLADFGRPEGYLERQVTRWGKQLANSRSRELPDLDALQAGLAEHTPQMQLATIVHGDYRLDNVIARDDDTIAAVLDWEMATLGDPLADLGLLRVYWDGLAALPSNPVTDAVSAKAGFPPGGVLLGSYSARSGLDLTTLPWYEAFSYYKLAVILEGIHYRYLHGRTVGDGFERIGELVPPLAAAGRTKLGEL